jgi:hypothetical protein
MRKIYLGHAGTVLLLLKKFKVFFNAYKFKLVVWIRFRRLWNIFECRNRDSGTINRIEETSKYCKKSVRKR